MDDNTEKPTDSSNTTNIDTRLTKIENDHIQMNTKLTDLENRIKGLEDKPSEPIQMDNPDTPTQGGKRRQSQRQSQRQKQRKQKQSGGDASNHAIAVYGSAGQQHAQAGSNIIASRQAGGAVAALQHSEVGNSSPLSSGSQTGGRRRRTRKNRKQQRQQTKHSRE